MTTPAILPSRNEDYGFFRTLTVCPQRDRRSTEVWTIASRLIAEAIRADSEDEMIGIRNFLQHRARARHRLHNPPLAGLANRSQDRARARYPRGAAVPHRLGAALRGHGRDGGGAE